jgi:hypothetical protein
MPQPALNPFFYPGPVPPARFVGREEEIYACLSRIATGQNTAVVGEPNIGKSSLLQHLADSHERLDEQAARTVFVFSDCHLLPSAFAPADFWRQALAPLWERCTDGEVRPVVDWAVQKGGLGGDALEKVFQAVTGRGWRLVLLIDEFDSLMHHPNFNTAEFFGALRALSTRFAGLALVTASRLSVAEMNRQGRELNPYGSPFFNGFIEAHLRPFDDEDVHALLDGALAGSGVVFDTLDYDFIHAMAGWHPFLVQAAAGALYDAHALGKQGPIRYREAGATFYWQTEGHFDDLWRNLEGRARTAAAVLCLAELHGRVAKQRYDVGDLGALERYGGELSRLAEQGLAELYRADGWHADWDDWVFWRGERWRVSSRRLVWWVSDQVLARDEVDWEEWLGGKRYHGLLTASEIQTLKTWAAKVPKGAIDTGAKVLGLLLKELLI